MLKTVAGFALLANIGDQPVKLEKIGVVVSPTATHIVTASFVNPFSASLNSGERL